MRVITLRDEQVSVQNSLCRYVSDSLLPKETGRITGELARLASRACTSPRGLSLANDAVAPLLDKAVVLPRRERGVAVVLLHTTLPRPSVMNGGSVSWTSAAVRISHQCVSSDKGPGFVDSDGGGGGGGGGDTAGSGSDAETIAGSALVDSSAGVGNIGSTKSTGTVGDMLLVQGTGVSAPMSSLSVNDARPGRVVLNRAAALLGADAGRTVNGGGAKSPTDIDSCER